METKSLGARLDSVMHMAGHGKCIADAGCDHGYVCINLIKSGAFDRAIAMDLREGPLARAKMNIASSGLSSKIECRLSDGLAALNRDEADTVVVAGMGGALICEIMDREADKFRSLDHFVLQPQSEIREVRKHLRDTGFMIMDENAVLEDGKYYFILLVKPAKENTDENEDPAEQALYDTFGRFLIDRKSPVLKNWLAHEKSVKESILKGLDLSIDSHAMQDASKNEPDASDESAVPERILQRRTEVNEYLKLIELALEKMD